MPTIENVLPKDDRRTIRGRELRAARVLRHLQSTEPVQIALGVRRDYRMWATLQGSAASLGVEGIESAERCARVLAGLRDLMLDLTGYPKRPSRGMIEEQIKRIQEAIPEEITIDQPSQSSAESSH
jgi:hypothetical protein